MCIKGLYRLFHQPIPGGQQNRFPSKARTFEYLKPLHIEDIDLKVDAEKILKLIRVQMDNLTMPQCPLYEEVLDTQMFGLSREIDFAVRLGLVNQSQADSKIDFPRKPEHLSI